MKVPFIISIAMPGSKRMEREGRGERRQREGRMGREKVSCVVKLKVIFGSDRDESWRRRGGGEHLIIDARTQRTACTSGFIFQDFAQEGANARGVMGVG